MKAIPQPGDKEVKLNSGRLKLTMELKWQSNFALRKTKDFWRAQCFVDAECIRYMDKYTPMRTGAMIKSVTLGTKIGSGNIVYNSPYARYQYYGEVYGPNIPIYKDGELMGWRSPKKPAKKYPTGREIVYSKDKHQAAQKLWFEKMKSEKGDTILRGALRIAGGGQ